MEAAEEMQEEPSYSCNWDKTLDFSTSPRPAYFIMHFWIALHLTEGLWPWWKRLHYEACLHEDAPWISLLGVAMSSLQAASKMLYAKCIRVLDDL